MNGKPVSKAGRKRVWRITVLLFLVICGIGIGLYFWLEPNAAAADREQYALYSSVIRDGLTG